MKQKKILIYVGIFYALLSGCTTYKPTIDTAGRSGSFNHSKSDHITSDLVICEQLAKQHTNFVVESSKYVWNYYFRPATLWLSPKAEYDYNKIYKNCLTGRGHNVIR